MLSHAVTDQPQPAGVAPRRRREVRFPDLLNVAITREITGGLNRVCSSFGGLYTVSDVARLALCEWLAARGALMAAPQPTGNTEASNGR